MITGFEPNIVRCMAGVDQAKHLAKQRAAEAKHAAEVEKTEQQLFLKYLRSQRAAGRLWFINPRSDKASTIEPGHPDYTIWIKGKVFEIEMKASGGKLSPEQEIAISFLQELDSDVWIAWSAKEAENIVESYLSVSTNHGKNDNTNSTTKRFGQAEAGA
jgi:hypothetical protein